MIFHSRTAVAAADTPKGEKLDAMVTLVQAFELTPFQIKTP